MKVICYDNVKLYRMRYYHDEREGRRAREKVSVRHKGNQKMQEDGRISDQQTQVSDRNHGRGCGGV